MRSVLLCCAVGWAVVSASARAEEEVAPAPVSSSQGWSVLAGQSVGRGDTVVHAQFGFPGLSATLLHGVSDKVDLGGRFAFNYGFEGLVELVPFPGPKVEGVLRASLINRGRINLGLKFTPGLFLYFPTNTSVVGMTLPLSVVLGISAGSAVMVNLGLDVPMFVTFGAGGGLTAPVLFGGGVEYFLDRTMAVTFNTRLGATTPLRPVFFRRQRSYFTFEALVGVSFKL